MLINPLYTEVGIDLHGWPRCCAGHLLAADGGGSYTTWCELLRLRVCECVRMRA